MGGRGVGITGWGVTLSREPVTVSIQDSLQGDIQDQAPHWFCCLIKQKDCVGLSKGNISASDCWKCSKWFTQNCNIFKIFYVKGTIFSLLHWGQWKEVLIALWLLSFISQVKNRQNTGLESQIRKLLTPPCYVTWFWLECNCSGFKDSSCCADRCGNPCMVAAAFLFSSSGASWFPRGHYF